MIKANNPNLKSWVDVLPGSDFPIQNLPFGVFETTFGEKRVCSAIGEYVIDLVELDYHGFLDGLMIDKSVFDSDYLNDLMAQGKAKTSELRNRLSEILQDVPGKWNGESKANQFLVNMKDVDMQMPVKIGDYTDFYSSIEHATNVGTMFRDPDNALLPNWRHLPVGYHGRASSIVVSGTDIHRPKGQMIPPNSEQPVFGPCRLLDFELEMGFVIGKPTQLGDSVNTANAEDYIFGLILFNDWSARDIQKWEYVPLGPFLGKNFASTVSPWIITLEALEPFRVQGPKQDPEVLPYLQYEGQKNYDISLEVEIQPENGNGQVVTRSNFKYMYWNMCQQLAHHTVNGCNINIGDLYASGTISGPTPDSYGSMLEISWKGTKSVPMPDGTERKFIQDGDHVIMRGWCEKDGVRIGFGEAEGKVLPAK
jgi:fumarylacetoacetase